MGDGRVVVGVDGSEGSRRALQWAAGEARHRGAPLEVVLAWSLAVQTSQQPFDPHHGEEAARTELTRIVDATLGEDRPPDTRLTVVNDLPSAGLLAVAQGAELVVVGSRGLGPSKRLLVGSVSNQVLHHAEQPVIVVPGDERHEHHHRHGWFHRREHSPAPPEP